MIVETERLLLRPLGIADLDDFVQLHEDPEVTRFITPFDRPQAQRRLRDIEREWAERGHGTFAVLDRTDGRFLGRAGPRYWPQFDETEVGWVLRRDAWGYGYATEAARACVDWSFSTLTVPYLTSMIDPPNSASIRVALRLSMTPLREDVLIDDEVIVYALNRDDWSAGLTAEKIGSNRLAAVESENLAAVREMVDLISRGELEELLDRFAAEDIELDYTRSLSPDQAGVFRGAGEVRGFWSALREPWQELELVADEYIEVSDDTVVVPSHTRQVGRGSGIEVVARGAMLFRLRDGKVVRWQLFQSKAEALEAAAPTSGGAD